MHRALEAGGARDLSAERALRTVSNTQGSRI